MSDGLVRNVDSIQLRVSDLEAGLAFYRDKLGHTLIWRSKSAVGLRMLDSGAELVLQIDRPGPEIDLKVESADAAAILFAEAGGVIRVPPFDIQVGRCVIVADPWGNEFVLLDLSKGLLRTDEAGNVIGNEPPRDPIATPRKTPPAPL